MSPVEAMATVESRAFALRKTMGELCQLSGVAQSTWSRAKKRGYIRAKKLAQIEDTLDWLERQRAEQQQTVEAAGG